MNEKEILEGKRNDKSDNSNIPNRSGNESAMDLKPTGNNMDSQIKQSSYKNSLYRRGDDTYGEQPDVPTRQKNITDASPSNSKRIGAIPVKPSWDTQQQNLKQLDGVVEKSIGSRHYSLPSTSDQSIHSSSMHSSSDVYPSDHSIGTSTAPSMVPLVRSNERQTTIYDNMERLQPERNIVKILPSGDSGVPLPGAWLHRGTSGRVDTNLTPDNDVEEILLDASYNAAEIQPDLHHNISAGNQPPPTHQIDAGNSNGEETCVSGSNFMNDSHQSLFTENASYEVSTPTKQRSYKLYAIWSLILLVIITGLGIGFGIPKNASSTSSSSATECSMDPILEACSTSDNTIEISTCLKERVTNFQQSFAFQFQDIINNSSTCVPENLAIMSVALQFTDGMSNHSVFQRYGLSLLYFATQGHNWITNENWLSDKAVCDWKNIECSTTMEDDVIGIKLGNNNLQGSIPSLFLNYLPSLQYLDLSENALKGTIPSNVDKLNQLILNSNELTGILPFSLIDSPSIESLSLQNNNALTWPRQGHFFSGQNWKEISLGNVIINFTFPTGLNLLPNLEVLELTDTLLNGEIPSEIGLLSKLLKFTTGFNSLTGQLPTEIGWMKSVKEIDISHNELNGTIPSQIGFLSNLEKFRMNNNVMVGNLPWELSKNTKLTGLVVSENKLSGTMPSELGRLSNLDSFLFSSNSFTGEIPLEVCNLKSSMSLFGEDVTTECPDFGALQCPEELPSCCCDIA